MNLKLDVVRFANEDVIATSVCKNFEETHFLVFEVNAEGTEKELYYQFKIDQNGKYGVLDDRTSIDDALPLPGVDSTGWWYDDGIHQNLVKCEDQSHDAHPSNPN